MASLLVLDRSGQCRRRTFPVIERLAIDRLDLFRITALKYRVNAPFLTLFL